MTAEVVFSVEWDDEPRLDNKVAVDVLDAHLTRLTSALIGQPLDLETGLYAARAVLPDGRHVESAFEVSGSTEPLDVPLKPSSIAAPATTVDPPDALSTSLVHLEFGDVAEFGKNLSRSVARGFGANTTPADAPDSGQAWVRTLAADGFDRFSPTEPSRLYGVGDTLELTAGPKPLFLQVRPPIWRISVPLRPVVASQASDRITVRMVLKGATVFPHFVFDNEDLELLMRYFGAGEVESAAEIAASHAIVAERALRDGRELPFSAAAGAYVLLRLPNLDQLSWTEQLTDRFPWMPDARAIHGEWLARLGRHEEALTQFLTVPSLGIPFFSMGVATASRRLLQYATSEQISRPDNFQPTLTQLGGLAKRVDFTRPITTFKP